MIKKVLENYVQKTKNPHFKFDNELDSYLILNLIFLKGCAFLRNLIHLGFSRRGKVFLGKSVTLFNRRNIVFGNNVTIGDFVKLSALGRGKLSLGNGVNIGAFSQIIISTSFNNIGESIVIEDNVGMGEFSYIGGGGGTLIGANTIIGQYFGVHPENHNYDNENELIRLQGVSRKGIIIGQNCWIGSKVTILDGVTIGNNCVIAAGSVVTKSFENNLLIGGVPAKVLKKIS